MEWRKQIHFGGFGDAVEMEFRMIKSWKSFKNYFQNAHSVRAVTYCDSPDLLLDLITGSDLPIETLDVTVGDDVDYRQQLTGKPETARRLEELRREETLIIRTCPSKVVHSKLYAIENQDGSRILINGSANFTRNAWTGQTNAATAYYTDGKSIVDEQFDALIEAHISKYADVFMDDLSARIEDVESEDERERIVQHWVDGRQTTRDEASELHANATEQIQKAVENADRAVRITDDPHEADETVDISINETNEDLTDGTMSESEPKDGENASSDTGVGDHEITLSTRGFDGKYAEDLGDGLKTFESTVGSETIATTTGSYTRYLEQKYEVPQCWLDSDSGEVHIQSGDDHRILTGAWPDSPQLVDEALENVEEYLRTVDNYGQTNHPLEVKSHMTEALLFIFWTPFINVYATRYHRAGLDLDKALPYLYIYGESDSGKGTFSKYALSLISDGLVVGAADADEIAVRRLRAMRNIDTAFPLVVDDITKQKIGGFDVLRNFWRQWTPELGVQYPALAFVSNDKRPKQWFRNRAKLLHFDVKFTSSHRGEAEVNRLIQTENPLYAWVSHGLFERGPSLAEEGDDVLEDVRAVMLDLYEYAGREVPQFFPHEPAEIVYDPGKRLWQTAYDQDVLGLRPEGETYVAEFELESTEVYRYEKNLPTHIRGEKRGREVLIKNQEGFLEWFERPIQESGSAWFSRIFS